MLSFEPNIIFIDDKKEEVEGIVKLYQNEGVGTKFYNADLTTGDDKPPEPFYDVNLIFLDLYYKSEFDVELCTGWIESIIPESSFYVLVLWSKDTHHADEIILDLTHISRKPYLTLSIQKGEEYKNLDNTWNFEKLHLKINSEVNKHHALNELALWKKSIKSSSNIIIGHLSKDTTSDDFNKKLQKIIIGHGGTSYISSNNKEQKREILFDALDNILISNAKGVRPLTHISTENYDELYNIDGQIQTDIDAMLNSWFHFKLNKEPLEKSKIESGLICQYNDDELKETYTLLEDENIKEYAKHQINKSNDENETKIIDIVLLISRPCDIAQNKYGRNLKLIGGVLVCNPERKTNQKKELKTGQKFNSIKLYDHLFISDKIKDAAIIFDFRYIFSVPKNTFIDKFENMKIFNKELLSDIQVEYGAYSSRLGITQII